MSRARIDRRAAPGWLAVAPLLALGLIATGCGSTQDSSSNGPEGTFARTEVESARESDDVEPVRGGALIMAVPAETNGWNPYVNQWADAGTLVGPSMIEPLVTMDADGEAEPWLLESWKSSDEFKTWEFTLKPGIEFHNGEKADADALKRSLEAKYAKGALASLAVTGYIDRFEVTGPLTVTAHLLKPWAQFAASMASTYLMAPEMLDREDRGTIHPIGTGPFVFQKWDQGSSLQVTKFDKYWRKDKAGRQLPYLDKIEFRPIIDDLSQSKALQGRDVDMALTTSATVAHDLQQDFTTLRDYTSERTFVMLNVAESNTDVFNPFTNLHARKALAYATDREEIALTIGDQVESTTQAFRPDSKWGIPNEQTGYYEFNIDKAKEEVAAYKQETGQNNLSFTFSGLTDLGVISSMQILQSQWKQAGIEATLDNIDQVKYITLAALGQYQATWFRYYGWPNPDSTTSVYSSASSSPVGQLSLNFTHYTSDQLDQNLQVGRSTDDFASRKSANDAIIREVNSQATNIWLYDTPYAVLAEKRVHGLNDFRTHPFGNFATKPWMGNVWLDSPH